MTISTTTNRVEYTGDGVQTAFAVPFLFFENSHLQVFNNNVIVSPGLYTVTGAGNPGGGTVTFTTAPGGGEVILILRIVPQTQLMSYPTFGAFPSASHEKALDLAAMGRQQLTDAITNPTPGGPEPGPTIGAWVNMNLNGPNWVAQPGKAIPSYRLTTYPNGEVFVTIAGAITANSGPSTTVATGLPAPNVEIEFAVSGQGQGNAYAMAVMRINATGDLTFVRFIPTATLSPGSGFRMDGLGGYWTVLPV